MEMAAVVGDAGRPNGWMLFGRKARLGAAMTCLLARGRGLRRGRGDRFGLAVVEQVQCSGEWRRSSG